MKWMIYGATGYTGRLVVQEAVSRGHRPLLAGRNVEKLQTLAAAYNLDYAAFHLEDIATVGEAIADVELVYHAAGPFIHTSDPMIRACLATGTHYLDITGEIPVFENTFRYDDAARKNGIALISGVGFDVVPTDCLGLYVAQQVSSATTLELGLRVKGGVSAGTTKSMLEMMPAGGYQRVDGELLPGGVGRKTRQMRFSNGKTYTGASIPWGDLSTSYRSTGIPNITTYFVLPSSLATTVQYASPVLAALMSSGMIRRAIGQLVDRTVQGPTEAVREQARSYIWARASNDAGTTAEAWLDTLEAYRFTAVVGVLAIERTLELQPFGALSPAQAFGADFVLDVPATTRFDALP